MTDLSALTQYAVVAFASLFILVDPLATAPLFIVMTAGDPPDKRRQMARRAARCGRDRVIRLLHQLW
jgi:multiple antibiotic resistance protein